MPVEFVRAIQDEITAPVKLKTIKNICRRLEADLLSGFKGSTENQAEFKPFWPKI
jgi:hypothetical protein